MACKTFSAGRRGADGPVSFPRSSPAGYAAEKKPRDREKKQFDYAFKRDQQALRDKVADEKAALDKELLKNEAEGERNVFTTRIEALEENVVVPACHSTAAGRGRARWRTGVLPARNRMATRPAPARPWKSVWLGVVFAANLLPSRVHRPDGMNRLLIVVFPCHIAAHLARPKAVQALAARAGEAGMGFAVVADEVRSLAQRSAQAARETADKIEGAIGKTTQGVQINAKVATALNDIVTKARQVDELVAEIAAASKEQSQGITQINGAVGQMDQVTQKNAASAEESAAAAEELNAQARAMNEAVADLLHLVGNQESPAANAAVDAAPAAASPSPEAPTPKVAGNGDGKAHARLVPPTPAGIPLSESRKMPAPSKATSRTSEGSFLSGPHRTLSRALEPKNRPEKRL